MNYSIENEKQALAVTLIVFLVSIVTTGFNLGLSIKTAVIVGIASALLAPFFE